MYGYTIQTDGRLTNPGQDYQPGPGVATFTDLRDWLAVRSLACPVWTGSEAREATPEELAAWFPPAPKHWSKYAILSSLAAVGLAEAFLGILQSDPLLYNLWLAAGDIAEDNPHFAAALPAVLAALGLTPEQAGAMLEGCEI